MASILLPLLRCLHQQYPGNLSFPSKLFHKLLLVRYSIMATRKVAEKIKTLKKIIKKVLAQAKTDSTGVMSDKESIVFCHYRLG